MCPAVTGTCSIPVHTWGNICHWTVRTSFQGYHAANTNVYGDPAPWRAGRREAASTWTPPSPGWTPLSLYSLPISTVEGQILLTAGAPPTPTARVPQGPGGSDLRCKPLYPSPKKVRGPPGPDGSHAALDKNVSPS